MYSTKLSHKSVKQPYVISPFTVQCATEFAVGFWFYDIQLSPVGSSTSILFINDFLDRIFPLQATLDGQISSPTI